VKSHETYKFEIGEPEPLADDVNGDGANETLPTPIS
jgi:hypothetical protein